MRVLTILAGVKVINQNIGCLLHDSNLLKEINTIWEKDMDETEIEFDEINFKEEFSLKPTVVKSSKSAANKSTKKQKNVIVN